MEVNLNCDLGEKSEHYSGINDQALIEIINTANIACGYHAGSESVIETTIKIAKENNVPIVENKPLARALYQAVQVDEVIPAEFYKAVAEVLAYVYSLNRTAA